MILPGFTACVGEGEKSETTPRSTHPGEKIGTDIGCDVLQAVTFPAFFIFVLSTL